MIWQIPLDASARADSAARGDTVHEIARDIAYRRLAIVNVEWDAGERVGRSTQELSFGRRIKICVNVPAIPPCVISC